ncbi:DUF2845 domain-containing protein [Desulfoluna butyratoxydans]|uniref:DUF2845 domain-containing protein n=1 Tax=Desulfoluna butyratoxydans TaxID=231438 RepID=A0A4U8YKQ2_9BACT|nr:DUF2845 domain-containing protein [Desulfoluna butyratoxydans]VFQ44476.1 protein of unknown function duf2845 [Desulfoluna butyratoxydans]
MIRVKSLAVAMVAAFLLASAVPAVAATSFRCGSTIVKPGMLDVDILNNCGEPSSREIVGKTTGKMELNIERWVYGPISGYMYILYFKAGTLEKIESYRP